MPVTHFSTYALFVDGESVAEVSPSMTVTPSRTSDGTDLRVLGMIIAALGGLGVLYSIWRKNP